MASMYYGRRALATSAVAAGRRIGVMPADDIGKEVVPCALEVLGHLAESGRIGRLEFVPLEAGWGAFERTGAALPAETVEALRGCDGALFGAVTSPSRRVEGYASPIVAMRKIFGLHANIRPCISAPSALGIPGSRDGVDMVIVRENTECLYVKDESLGVDDESGLKVAVAKRVISQAASEKIARTAFNIALQRKDIREPLVTIVHKSNVLSISDGLFRESCLHIAKTEFPTVKYEEQLVDSMVYRMIREPERYNVVVAPNLYGDILSDGAAAMVGGLGLVASANMGDNFVMVEPVHGSAPDIAGKGIANPLATIRAAAMLLDYLGETEGSRLINAAVDKVLLMPKERLTPDLGGSATTKQITDAVLEQLG